MNKRYSTGTPFLPDPEPKPTSCAYRLIDAMLLIAALALAAWVISMIV